MPQRKTLLEFPARPSGTVVVNDRVSIRTEGTHRAVFVQGLVLLHYDVGDRAAEACAMVTLSEAGYADQNDIARAFACSPRSLRRYQQRIDSGGLPSLDRPRGPPSHKGRRPIDGQDRTILRLKEHGLSPRAVAVRLGFSEKAIRKRLRRLGWKPQPQACLPFAVKTDDAAPPATRVSPARITEPTAATAARAVPVAANQPFPVSFDCNPLGDLDPVPDPLSLRRRARLNRHDRRCDGGGSVIECGQLPIAWRRSQCKGEHLCREADVTCALSLSS